MSLLIYTLHLYLRICDNVIQLFIRELKIGDSIDKKKTYSHNLSRDKYEHMAGYESYLQSLGIPFHWYVGKETKQLESDRDLTGLEKVFTFSGPVKSRYSTSTISKFHPFCQIHQTVELSKKFGMISEVLQKIWRRILTWIRRGILNLRWQIGWKDFSFSNKQKMSHITCMHFYAHVPEFPSLYGDIYWIFYNNNVSQLNILQ